MNDNFYFNQKNNNNNKIEEEKSNQITKSILKKDKEKVQNKNAVKIFCFQK